MQYPIGWTEAEEAVFREWAAGRGVKDPDSMNALYDYRRAFREQGADGLRPEQSQNALMSILERKMGPEFVKTIKTKDLPVMGDRGNGLNLKYQKDGKLLGIFADSMW